MDTIVTDELKTNSRRIAEVYGKQHKNVLRQIDNLVADLGGDTDEFCRLNFEPVEFIEVFENKSEARREYILTEAGALMLTGRMTGAAAARKQKLVAQAFVAMKRTIKDQRLKADADVRKQLEDTRATLQVYENLLESKANTLAKLLNIAPSKTRPYFQQLVDAGVLEQQEKVIHGFAYKPTATGLDLVNHVDKNGIIHWKPEVLQLLNP